MQADAAREEMERVERDLTMLSRAIAYPATPSLAQAVRRRLSSAKPAPAAAPRWQLALTAVAAAAVVAAAALGSIAPARDAVADFFERINIFETDQPLEGLPTEVRGAEMSPESAGARLGSPILQPGDDEGLTREKLVFQDFGEVKAAVSFYRTDDGRLSRSFRQPRTSARACHPDGDATSTPIYGLGNSAYWIEGAHLVQFYDFEGQVIGESVRRTGTNTLVWDRDGLIFRIEGDLSQDEAVQIAQSLR